MGHHRRRQRSGRSVGLVAPVAPAASTCAGHALVEAPGALTRKGLVWFEDM
jgi:hypothetical protein